MLRGLAVEVGRVLGAASACPNVARPRIGAISSRVTAIIKSSAANPEETAAIFELLNDSQAEGSRSVSARQIDCTAIERQLADLENIAAPVAQGTPAGAARPIAFAGQAAAGALRGITANEIVFGISAPLSGSARELGLQMQTGIETAFNAANDEGGVNGRMLRLVAADDGYEPARTAETIKELYERDRIFGFIGNVGTPTALVSAPFALEHRMLFFGAFTGADLLRRDPPDRYVFNYRASYRGGDGRGGQLPGQSPQAQDRPDRGVRSAGFASAMPVSTVSWPQCARCAAGTAAMCFASAISATRWTSIPPSAQLRAYKVPIKAIVMVATYRAAAKFIEKTHDQYPGLVYTNVSFVGSTSLKDELMLLGPQYAAGVVVTQSRSRRWTVIPAWCSNTRRRSTNTSRARPRITSPSKATSLRKCSSRRSSAPATSSTRKGWWIRLRICAAWTLGLEPRSTSAEASTRDCTKFGAHSSANLASSSL